MIEGLIALLVAVVAFVGTHFVLSHPLRAPLVGALGEGGFQLLYGLVSVTLLLLALVAYHRAPHAPVYWSSDNLVLQIVFSVGSCFAAALFVASLIDNPAFIGAQIADLSTRPPSGVYRITRHPMMFAIAIWSVEQTLINPTVRNLIVFGGFVVLALAGSRLQDRKKIAQTGREWSVWASRTPFWPDLRRWRRLGLSWLFGIALWLTLTWLESHVTLTPIGAWYWLPGLT